MTDDEMNVATGRLSGSRLESDRSATRRLLTACPFRGSLALAVKATTRSSRYSGQGFQSRVDSVGLLPLGSRRLKATITEGKSIPRLYGHMGSRRL